jgi:hypothetical protein
MGTLEYAATLREGKFYINFVIKTVLVLTIFCFNLKVVI